jgi:hypothetical protein
VTQGQNVTWSYRPRRVRVIGAVCAAAVLILFTGIGTALATGGEQGAVFQKGDQYAMIGLGVLFAAGVMLIAKPKVSANAAGIQVKNIIGGYELPWDVVRAVRFDRGQPWMYLDLENDDTVSVLAIQAVDKQHALEAVRTVRALHSAAVSVDNSAS